MNNGMNRRNSLQLIVSAAFGSGFGKGDLDSLLREHEELSEIEKIACRYFSLAALWCQTVISEVDCDFLREIENHIDIPEVGADDFRRGVAAYLGHLFMTNKDLQWNSQPELTKAFEAFVKP